MKTSLFFLIAVLVCALNLGAADCSETKPGWNEAGIRLGIQAGPKLEYFHLYEAYAVYGLPWELRSSSGWGVETQLNTSLGALHADGETGAFGSVGTGLTVTKKGFNLVPELGINLDLMDRRQFARQDFGSILLWGAYIGLAYRFDCGLDIGYRIEHLSNNHILYAGSTPNPGVDFHLISTSWRF